MMKIAIEIQREFEIDFKRDKFKDFFSRVIADIDYSFNNADIIYLCGNYETEIAKMLIEAFNNGEVITNDSTFVSNEFSKKHL